MRDVRIVARRLAREPGFTGLVVFTLALGIGATTTIFSVVDGVLLRPLPYRDADRLVTLWQWNQTKGIDEPPAPANFVDWREASRLVDIAAAEPYSLDLTGGGDPVALDAWLVSERFFSTIRPALLLLLAGAGCLLRKPSDGPCSSRRSSAAWPLDPASFLSGQPRRCRCRTKDPRWIHRTQSLAVRCPSLAMSRPRSSPSSRRATSTRWACGS